MSFYEVRNLIMPDFVSMVNSMDIIVAEETLRAFEINSYPHLKEDKERTKILDKYRKLLPKRASKTVSAREMARLLNHG
tara:strand:- start:818 stop:1054 length:237 start_codon:yes stop_codon:yes gene_type:complete